MWLVAWFACGAPVDDGAAARAGAVALTYGPAADEVALTAQQAEVRSHPESVEAWTALSVTYLNRSRETGADVYLQYADDAARAALELDPGALVAAQVRVRVQHDRHQFAEGAERAAALAERHPQDSTALLLHADALLELGRYEAALEVVQRALDVRPDLRTYNRGSLLRWLYGDLEGAIALQVSAIGAGGVGLPEPTAFCLVDLATLELHAGRPERALRAAEAALELVPDYPLAQSARARAYAAAGQAEPAIDVLVALGGRAAISDQYLLADLLEARGEAERAAALRAQADGRGAADPRAVAYDLARRGRDVPRAVALATAAAAERPTVENLNTLALALLRAGQVERALDASDRAVGLGTADPRLHLTRGLIAAAAGDAVAARESLSRAGPAGRHADPVLYDELAAKG